MKRNPTIYITKTTLANLLDQLGVEQAEQIANKLVTLATPHNLTTRTMVTGRAATKKKIKQDIEASKDGNTDLFNSILNSIRISNTYANAKVYKKGTADYRVITKIAIAATKFAEVFNLPLPEAYTDYINIGLKLMGNRYGLSKFSYYEDKIYLERESKAHSLEDDKDKATLQFYKVWVGMLAKEAGVTFKVAEGDYKIWVNFVYGRQEADKVKAKYSNWITAQYEGLAFLDTIPEVYQLHGEGAKERYTKWKLNNSKKIKSLPSRLSKEERGYYAKLKGK